MPWWNFIKANKLPTPGAMEFALWDNRQTQSPMIGPAIMARFQFATINPTNIQTMGMRNTTGVGGLISGGIVLQPLSNPYQQ